MKKITLFFIALLSAASFAQQKSTGVIALSNSVPITANFTLNNSTSQVTLQLSGPADRWFGLGLGIVSGFGMSNGDVIVFTTATTPNLTDRNFAGAQNPPQDASQDWNTVSNIVSGTTRTLTLTRALTTSDANDLQLPYTTTNSINIGGVRAGSANFNVSSHGGSASAGYALNAPFTTLEIEDFSLNVATIYPNPSNGKFTINTKTGLDKVSIYTHTGTLIKTIELTNGASETKLNIEGLAAGIYLIQLQNSTEKSWKKVLVE